MQLCRVCFAYRDQNQRPTLKNFVCKKKQENFS